MRTAFWLLILVLAVLVTGAIATWRVTKRAAAAEAVMTRVGTVKEIMEGIVDPNADVVWESVATNITAAGVEDKAPRTDEEWAVVQHSALMLAEAANLLKIKGREIARADDVNMKSGPDAPELTPPQIQEKVNRDWSLWISHANRLQETAIKAWAVANARNVNGIIEVGDTLDKACESCHLEYWYPDMKKPRGERAGSRR
jgi:cytochrome c556